MEASQSLHLSAAGDENSAKHSPPESSIILQVGRYNGKQSGPRDLISVDVTQPLGQLFQYYRELEAISDPVDFVFLGKKLLPQSTPLSLLMEDGDVIMAVTAGHLPYPLKLETPEKGFFCCNFRWCGLVFEESSDELLRHMNVHYNTQGLFFCTHEECPLVFTQNDELSAHLEDHDAAAAVLKLVQVTPQKICSPTPDTVSRIRPIDRASLTFNGLMDDSGEEELSEEAQLSSDETPAEHVPAKRRAAPPAVGRNGDILIQFHKHFNPGLNHRVPIRGFVKGGIVQTLKLFAKKCEAPSYEIFKFEHNGMVVDPNISMSQNKIRPGGTVDVFLSQEYIRKANGQFSESSRKPFACGFNGCKEGFSKRKYLHDHRYSVHNVSLFPHKESHASKVQIRDVPGARQKASKTGGYNTQVSSDERIHACQYADCEMSFKRSEHLKRHIQSVHTTDRFYPCVVQGCKRAFTRKDNRNQHLAVHVRAGKGLKDMEDAGVLYHVSKFIVPAIKLKHHQVAKKEHTIVAKIENTKKKNTAKASTVKNAWPKKTKPVAKAKTDADVPSFRNGRPRTRSGRRVAEETEEPLLNKVKVNLTRTRSGRELYGNVQEPSLKKAKTVVEFAPSQGHIDDERLEHVQAHGSMEECEAVNDESQVDGSEDSEKPEIDTRVDEDKSPQAEALQDQYAVEVEMPQNADKVKNAMVNGETSVDDEPHEEPRESDHGGHHDEGQHEGHHKGMTGKYHDFITQQSEVLHLKPEPKVTLPPLSAMLSGPSLDDEAVATEALQLLHQPKTPIISRLSSMSSPMVPLFTHAPPSQLPSPSSPPSSDNTPRVIVEPCGATELSAQAPGPVPSAIPPQKSAATPARAECLTIPKECPQCKSSAAWHYIPELHSNFCSACYVKRGEEEPAAPRKTVWRKGLCSLCGADSSPQWRSSEDRSKKYCNACSLYWARHKKPRPVSWSTDPAKARERRLTRRNDCGVVPTTHDAATVKSSTGNDAEV